MSPKNTNPEIEILSAIVWKLNVLHGHIQGCCELAVANGELWQLQKQLKYCIFKKKILMYVCYEMALQNEIDSNDTLEPQSSTK